jgi:pimeloyl-ACP methyl ester carboxylesterase
VLRFAAEHPAMRSLAYGMIFGRPRALDPEAAFGDSLALRDGKSFREVAEAGGDYVYRGDPGVPTTIAWGTKDRVLLRRQFRHARRVLPHARFVDLPGCGHVPMNDDPGLVAGTILRTTGAA